MQVARKFSRRNANDSRKRYELKVTLLKMTLWRHITLLMVSRYLWYRITNWSPEQNTRSTQIAIKAVARCIDGEKKSECRPENGDGFVHVWSGVVGQSDKARRRYIDVSSG